MTQRASGWYDDPHDENLLRYFDGILWSDRTMPKLRPGLEHVGEARPASELPRHDEPHRRDGAPRTYPAHWGPEQPGRSNNRFAPPPAGSRPPQQFGGPRAFGDRSGQPAGMGARFAAYLIDSILVSLVVAVFVTIFSQDTVSQMRDWMNEVLSASRSGSTTAPDLPDSLQNSLLLITIVAGLASVVYEAVMITLCRGRTVGRMLLNLAVVPADSDPRQVREARVGFGWALLRSALKWGPGVIGSLGELVKLVFFLSAFGNERRAGLHDRAARTLVRRRS